MKQGRSKDTWSASFFSGHKLFWEKEKNKDEEHPLLPYHCTEPSALRGYNIPEVKGMDLSDHAGSGRKSIISPEKISDENLAQKNAVIGKYEETDHIRMKGRLLGGCMDCLQNAETAGKADNPLMSRATCFI